MNRLFLLGVAMSLLVSCGGEDNGQSEPHQPMVQQVIQQDPELIRELVERKAVERKLSLQAANYSGLQVLIEKFVNELSALRSKIRLYDCDFMMQKLKNEIVPERDALMHEATRIGAVVHVTIQQVFSDFVADVRREICADKTDDDFKDIQPLMVTVLPMGSSVDTVDGIMAVTADGEEVVLSESTLDNYVNDFDTTVYKIYNRFAKETGGVMGLLSKSEHIDKILDQIKSHIVANAPPTVKIFDVVFVVDFSGSMVADWADVKTGIARFMSSLDAKFQWSLVGTSNDATERMVLVNGGSSKAITDALDKAELFDESGAELDEDVYSGLLSAAHHVGWREGARRIAILIGDAAPKKLKKRGIEINRSVMVEIFREEGVTLYPVMIMD